MLNYIKALWISKMPLEVIKTSLGPFAVRVVIQFSRIVYRSHKSASVRPDVRDELFILPSCDVAVNKFLCSRSRSETVLRGGKTTMLRSICQQHFCHPPYSFSGARRVAHPTVPDDLRQAFCVTFLFFSPTGWQLRGSKPTSITPCLKEGGKIQDTSSRVNG